MIDKTRIYVKAGDGGSGCNSFKGVKFTRSYHSDGGSGGRGADVLIRVDKNIRDLKEFRGKQHFRAEKGKDGSGNKKKGADSRPCIIRVPPGTIIRDVTNNLLLGELTEPDQELLAAKAGEGGRANTKTQAATRGLPGEEKELSLELKLVAEIALIGYPNSGKSTLLTKISSCSPKIAAYPFTTTSPIVGPLELSEELPLLTAVEIPGLIKGSNQGKGLGAQFLRHAERAKLLLHLIDMAGSEGRDPCEDYHNLNQELKDYNRGLCSKPQMLIANKMDLPEAGNNLKKFSSKIKEKVYPVSAKESLGIEEVLEGIRGLL